MMIDFEDRATARHLTRFECCAAVIVCLLSFYGLVATVVDLISWCAALVRSA